MEIKGEMLTKVIQQFREERRRKKKRERENAGVMPLLCFINAMPCAPVSGSQGLVRLWRLWVKTDFAPSGGGCAGNMWQLICANKHLWRRGGGGEKTPAGAPQPCHLHRPPLCLWLTEGRGKPDKHTTSAQTHSAGNWEKLANNLHWP